jgi:hypothetical protein
VSTQTAIVPTNMSRHRIVTATDADRLPVGSVILPVEESAVGRGGSLAPRYPLVRISGHGMIRERPRWLSAGGSSGLPLDETDAEGGIVRYWVLYVAAGAPEIGERVTEAWQLEALPPLSLLHLADIGEIAQVRQHSRGPAGRYYATPGSETMYSADELLALAADWRVLSIGAPTPDLW